MYTKIILMTYSVGIVHISHCNTEPAGTVWCAVFVLIAVHENLKVHLELAFCLLNASDLTWNG